MSEKFSLKWYDFEVNVTKSFRRLRYEDDFYDVTLVSSDKKLLSVHKVVLSSCSEYFRGILSQSKQANLLLCLEGISSVEVTNVLDYIYNGELQMPRDSLQRFLEIADRFQLEGLAGNAKGIIKTTENTDDELKKCIGSQSGLDNENWFWTNKTGLMRKPWRMLMKSYRNGLQIIQHQSLLNHKSKSLQNPKNGIQILELVEMLLC